MNTLYKNEQSGRSMVEMLGVLAIIGVLSIGGISGYSKAMAKYRVNKTLDQISMLVMNIRSLFSASVDYADLSTDIAIQMGIIPGDMRDPDNTAAIVNAYQGSVFVGNPDNDTRQFYVQYTGLTQEACVALATADWGSQAGSGLVSLAIGPATNKKDEVESFAETITVDQMPVGLATAASACSSTVDSIGNAIQWTYY